ncbi:hypothetical protein ACOANU_29230 [Pseudomonas aeruginosa]|nr:hypothetical protein [Pseudomonas aeruginosa]HCR1538712.1 hypothetical protein [Pseudomonas aeruginosa]HCU2483965.1 hypothetical protein [Pseudomonas aeruginosa]HEJ3116547.1 hypothetical protein [Pseudomonas aeruginosa]HEJ3121182.1 hypothetical protein [Pseudomonas aeruginosa]
MSMELNKESVEQAGGDERAAFELFVRKHCGMPAHIAVNWDAKFTNDAWEGWKARAALAQPSPALPPFAEKVLAKLRRFYDCAEDFESGGVDIGRHWLDLLTQLGLLNRVQRSPALWEISQQGEDLLGAPQHFPARTEQAEAERPELWAVHAQGPDELYAAFTREDAEKHAAELNALPMPEGIAVGAVVVPSPWPAVQHWQYLAEQEQDHKNEIAGRLRQLERICEGLPQDAIDGGWTAQGIRGYAKRLEDQLKAALARVAELEQKSAGSWTVDTSCGRPILMYEGCSVIEDQTAYEVIRMIKWIGELERQEPVATVAKVPGEDWNSLDFHRDLQDMQPGTKLYAAPVAQAGQVPAAWYYDAPSQAEAAIIDIRGMWGEDDCPTYEDVASALRRLLAAAPGNSAQHSVPEGWKLVPSDKGCVTSSMKAECIGEFSFYIRAACAECLDVGTDSDCHVCGGDIEYDQKIDVPWDTCKEIYKTMLAAAPGKEGL